MTHRIRFANFDEMTPRQKILKWAYPLFVWYKKLKGETKELKQNHDVIPPVPFYDLSVRLNNGQELNFRELKGKKILIVNTASNCGYTNQYAELQKLFQQHQDKLVILGFPSNDFKEQEKGSDEDIAQFCQVNYGVTFPLIKKSAVKGSKQNKVFKWLTNKELNGWNTQQPSWNFSKYLVNEKGYLTHYFDPAVSPLSVEVINAVNDGQK